MLSIKTTKEVSVSIHTDETSIIEFRYNYKRPNYKGDTFIVRVDAYYFDNYNNPILLSDGCRTEKLNNEELSQLMTQAEQLTPQIDGESILDYFERLIATGIKLVITTRGYYKNTLTFSDFE